MTPMGQQLVECPVWAGGGGSAECLTCALFTHSPDNPVRGVLLLPPFSKMMMAGVKENLLQALEILDSGGDLISGLPAASGRTQGDTVGPVVRGL